RMKVFLLQGRELRALANGGAGGPGSPGFEHLHRAVEAKQQLRPIRFHNRLSLRELASFASCINQRMNDKQADENDKCLPRPQSGCVLEHEGERAGQGQHAYPDHQCWTHLPAPDYWIGSDLAISVILRCLATKNLMAESVARRIVCAGRSG